MPWDREGGEVYPVKWVGCSMGCLNFLDEVQGVEVSEELEEQDEDMGDEWDVGGEVWSTSTEAAAVGGSSSSSNSSGSSSSSSKRSKDGYPSIPGGLLSQARRQTGSSSGLKKGVSFAIRPLDEEEEVEGSAAAAAAAAATGETEAEDGFDMDAFEEAHAETRLGDVFGGHPGSSRKS